MTSKKERIREFARDVPAAEIADELDTSAGYVYKVRSETRREAPSPDRDESADVSGIDMDVSESEPSDAEESPLADLVIQDEYDEYECECGAPLEYLQNECDECGAEPAWWSE